MDEGMCALYTGDQYPVRYGLALTSESASFDHVMASACQLDTSVSPRLCHLIFASIAPCSSPRPPSRPRYFRLKFCYRRFTGRPPALAYASSSCSTLRELGPCSGLRPAGDSRYYV